MINTDFVNSCPLIGVPTNAHAVFLNRKIPMDIQPLIRLLDDPDERVFSHIRQKLLAIGEDVIPELELAWEENPFGVLFLNRIENIIHEIQFESLSKALHEWAVNGGTDLLSGALLVARYQYPDLDENETVLRPIEQIQQDIWLEINQNLTALEQVKVMNHILFEVHGFSGNTVNYHAPQNSFINTLMESKKGNPLSLCVLYSVIAQNLGIPIYGINLPRHFVLAYMDKMSLLREKKIEDADVLFYINPFSRGMVFSKGEIDNFLKQLEVEPAPLYYRPCSNVEIIQRNLNNLHYSYEQLGHMEKAGELLKLIRAVSIK